MPEPRKKESRQEFLVRCVPYVLQEPGTTSREHAYAKCVGIWESYSTVHNQARDVLRGDPSRTKLIRDSTSRDMRVRFNRLLKAIRKLIVDEDALGMSSKNKLTMNTRWQFRSDEQKITEFDKWLQDMFSKEILVGLKNANGVIEWIEKAYTKGAEAAFKAVRKVRADLPIDIFKGAQAEFIRSHVTGPVALKKLKLLQTRTLTDLKNVNADMARRLENVLVDGLVQGKQPYELIPDIKKAIGVNEFRAETIARTEIVRANAEGNLDALEALGVDEVAVLVEWSTAGDQRVCSLCKALEGVTLKLKEAHNLIPRHPNCRCAFIPANVGEPAKEQVRTKEEIQSALEESLRKENPGISPEEAKRRSTWSGADFEPAKKNKDELEGYGSEPSPPKKRKRKSKAEVEESKRQAEQQRIIEAEKRQEKQQELEEQRQEEQLDDNARERIRKQLDRQAKEVNVEIDKYIDELIRMRNK